MTPLVLCLLVCLSMHACSARYLGFIGMEARNQLYITKDVDNLGLHRTSSYPSQMLRPNTHGQLEVGNINGKGYQDRSSLIGATPIKQRDIGVPLLKEEEGKEDVVNVIVSSNIMDSQELAVIKVRPEVLKMAGRSLLGSSSQNTDKAEESKGNDFVEDVVVMDYAQPHRKPPIHNEKH